MKKSESESESVIKLRIERLERLVKLIQEEIITMQRGDNWGGKHQNDGGWFD
jgi:chemotaxis protein histidine kinase CheA